MDKATNLNGKDEKYEIARIILYVSIGGLVALSVAMLIGAGKGEKDNWLEASRYVFSAVLPLLGTWVGTILAYYFSKENFESANRNVRELVDKIPLMEKLKGIAVTAKMIPRAKIDAVTITKDKPPEKTKLIQDLVQMMKDKDRNRLPLLDENDHPKYMIHRSMIDKYLIEKAVEKGLTTDQLREKTLKDLIDDDPKLKAIFEGSFVTLREDATLADAKLLMEKTPDCLDVFVTKNGGKDDPVVGWLTNLIISESCKA